MRRTLLFLLALCAVLTTPVAAGRITSTAVTHEIQSIYQVNPCDPAQALLCFQGYAPAAPAPMAAIPGVLCINPGGPDWPNFVAAAQAGVAYTVKNTTFVKTTPEYTQCFEVFPPHTITQQGTQNIRMWWPLMYEVPSTTYTLTILYGTPQLFDDDGAGPNPPAWAHVEQWTWHVDSDLYHLSLLLALFHELPFGRDEVPLISDELLYAALQQKVLAAFNALQAGNTAEAAAQLADFELEVMDACIAVSPPFPNPFGFGTGIANTPENPACCKLLVDVEFILADSGIGMPAE